MAVALARSGKKVIFIDANLRKSVLVGRYKINKSVKGLTQFLSGINKFEEIMYGTNVDNLNVVLSGAISPNPELLLGNKVFKTLIKVLKELYDYIIIDTPAVELGNDALIIAKECDGVVMVVESDMAKTGQIQLSIDRLKDTRIKILGVVLNKVNIKNNRYYKKKYDKYSEDTYE